MTPHRTASGYGWASRILAAAVVTLLMASVALFLQARNLQQQISEGRHERNVFQAAARAQLCELLATQSRVSRERYAALCS